MSTLRDSEDMAQLSVAHSFAHISAELEGAFSTTFSVSDKVQNGIRNRSLQREIFTYRFFLSFDPPPFVTVAVGVVRIGCLAESCKKDIDSSSSR
jgi:hypothetical protein